MKTRSFFSYKIHLLVIVFALFMGNESVFSQNPTAKTSFTVNTGYVPVNGMKMYYEVHGQATTDAMPLIVIHGAYMNIPSMGAIIPAHAATHHVYALEMQGHGR